jgi:hypothetical protein
MNDRILIDLSQNGIEVFIQSEELDQESLLHSLRKEGFSALPQGEDPAGGLNDIGLPAPRKPKELSTFHGVLERKGEDSETKGHGCLLLRGLMTKGYKLQD